MTRPVRQHQRPRIRPQCHLEWSKTVPSASPEDHTSTVASTTCSSPPTRTGEHAAMNDHNPIRLRRLTAALAAAVLAVITMTGCTAGGGESPSGSATTNPGYDPAAKPPAQSTNDIRQRTDLHNERVSSWSRYEVVSNHSIRVFFTMGDPQCHGVRATIDEDTTAVRITLYEGTLPDAPTECTTLAASASLLVATRDPVGTRSVISGD